MVDVSCGRRVEWSCEPGAEAGMNFDFGEQHEAFRKDVRHWLETHLPDDLRGRAFAASRADVAEVKKLRAWQHTMHAAGYVGMDWPREFGGRGASIVEMVILYQEMARAESPQFVNRGGISMLGPTLMKHGTPAQQARFLPKILTAEELWCQGFSEPGAGSDLANLQTRAVRDDGHFVVNGQKVWTSMAHVADWCFLLVRTSPEAPKHKGISFLLVDMSTRRKLMPLCLGASGLVRTRRKHQSATCAMLVQTFWPLTTKWPSSRTARVWRFARSEPAPGSEKPWHQSSSAVRIFGRKRACCAGVPCFMSVGPSIEMPPRFTNCGDSARAISW